MTIHGISAGTPIAPPAASQRGTAAPAAEPSLWTMLSHAERAFFLSPEGAQAIGYGPGGHHTVAAPVLGQQLDIRG